VCIFDKPVMREAQAPHLRRLERLKRVAIVIANFHEFFMKRIGPEDERECREPMNRLEAKRERQAARCRKDRFKRGPGRNLRYADLMAVRRLGRSTKPSGPEGENP